MFSIKSIFKYNKNKLEAFYRSFSIILNNEQKELRRVCKTFSDNELKPVAGSLDKHEW